MELKFKFLGRSCWFIEVDKKFKIASNPSFNEKKGDKINIVGSTDEALKNIKLWLITECSPNNFDEEGAKVIEDDAKIIARKECGQFLRDKKNANIYFLDWFKKRELEIKGYRLIVEVIPTYRGGGFLSNPILGKANGYLLTIVDREGKAKRIYITGDTIYQENIIKTLIYYPINILIANIGHIKNSYFTGEKTMDLVMLNSFIRTLNPEEVITIFSKGESSRKELKKYIELIEIGEEKDI
ncbi:MBL fold metallo-hydrolase [Cetobacterium sp.]|uniref:MBL fold metallo-hydrolase n=1 Tax=Cetobacterium sp. TaxID=2071632 RepID=UPI003AF1BB03